MKVTLINLRHSDSVVMPLGVLYLAAVLEKSGHQVSVFDPFFKDRSFVKKVKKFRPDLIGFSVLTATYDLAKDMANFFRKEMPKTLLCAGGIHPTALPKETLEELNLDFVVFGEGEETLLEVCQRLDKGKSLKNVKGVVFKEKGKIVKNPPRSLIGDLDSLPFPARHLLSVENYLIPPGYIRSFPLARTLTIYSSRGCPAACTFCASHLLFGRNTRRRSVGNVISEIKMLKKDYKLNGIYFMDDTFAFDQNWVTEFCQRMERSGLDLVWGCQTRVTTVTEALLRQMRQAGCVQVDFGVESGSEKVLKALKKGQKPQDIKRAFRLAKKVGLRTFATVMVGSPREKREDIKKTEKILQQISPCYTHICFCTPLPGTELYGEARQMGWIPQNFGNNWDFIKTDQPIMTVNFSPKELVAIRAGLYNSIFWQNLRLFFIPRNLAFFLLVAWAAILHPRELFGAFRRLFATKNTEDLVHALLYLYRQSKICPRAEKRK